MRTRLGILIVALGSPAAWAQPLSTAPARVSLLLQTNVAAPVQKPVEFSVRRAEIVLSGEAAPRLGYLVNYDPVVYWLLKDAKVSWTFRPALIVAAGRFKYPQGLEGRTPSGRLLFIERSDLGRAFGDQREVGAQIAGRTGVLEYAAAAINDRTLAARAAIVDGPTLVGLTGLYSRGWPRWRTGIEARVESSSWTWQGEIGFGEDSYRVEGGGYVAVARMIHRFRPALRLQYWGSDPAGTRPFFVYPGPQMIGCDWFMTGDEARGSKLSVNYLSDGHLLVQWQVQW